MAELRNLGISVGIGAERVEELRRRFPDLAVVVELDLDKVPAALAEVDAFVGRGRHVELLANATRLRWVQTLTAGADAVSFPDLERRGIVMTNGSGIHAPNLAEHLLMLMLAFARNLPRLMRAQQRHEWARDERQFELMGQTLCVVGLGDIGLALAERAAAIGMRVTGVRRRDLPVPPCVSAVARLDDMDPLLSEADHVAICLPLTTRTGAVFDARRLALLKPSAYLYNIGRGEIVDQDALTEALRTGRLAGAGLDVATPEPLPPDNPLWDMENVIITSHSGGASPRRMDRFLDLLSDNITRYRADQPLRNVVDPVEGY
jgi:phosphoglycerate dehydrogenase-like enzyme